MASLPTAQPDRSLFNHGPGKGDKERSSGWRANYDEINWTGVGMVRRGVKQIKSYRVRPACQGPNCGCTDGISHSPECRAEHDAQC